MSQKTNIIAPIGKCMAYASINTRVQTKKDKYLACRFVIISTPNKLKHQKIDSIIPIEFHI